MCVAQGVSPGAKDSPHVSPRAFRRQRRRNARGEGRTWDYSQAPWATHIPPRWG